MKIANILSVTHLIVAIILLIIGLAKVSFILCGMSFLCVLFSVMWRVIHKLT